MSTPTIWIKYYVIYLKKKKNVPVINNKKICIFL